MAKVCELCGKSTTAGKSIQHHHAIKWRYRAPKSTRAFKPNLRKIKVDLDGKVQSIYTCMKCYKRLQKDSE
ncbi:MAG: large ribosomal subunit protein bL28 [Candidatus Dojkabacteria bacterium]